MSPSKNGAGGARRASLHNNPIDDKTGTLPGIDELPVLRRGTVQQRKKIMGYEAPKSRRNCANCKHMDIEQTPSGYEVLTCVMGSYQVQRFSLCKLWESELPDDLEA